MKKKNTKTRYMSMDGTDAYCDPEFSLDKLARELESNGKYISQVINNQFGKNFNNFINHYRINMACLRLKGDNQYAMFTIKAIGQSVGYKSHASFVRAFKSIVGMNPSDYQKIAQKSKNQQEDNNLTEA